MMKVRFFYYFSKMNYKRPGGYFFIVFLTLALGSTAQFFKENKGQWASHILYKADLKSGALFIEKEGITYNLFNAQSFVGAHKHQLDASKIEKLRFHGLKMLFRSPQKTATVESYQKSRQYFNYFTGKNPEKWQAKVPAYNEILYRNIFNGIDFKLTYTQSELEYTYKVNPYADPAQIVVSYAGAGKLFIDRNGNLHITNSIEDFIEEKPYAYQRINNQKVEVSCAFELLNDSTFSFRLGKYNPAYPLIIDPVLVFCSYSGSTADNFGMTATPGTDGSFYAGGTTFNIGYPTTLGAYDVNFHGTPAYGITDVVITRYDSAGSSLIYSTYLGGIQAETVHSMIVNDSNELYIYGATGSADFPVTANAFDTVFNGGPYLFFVYNGTKFNNGTDMYVAHFSADGSQLLNCTYLGGSDNDGVNHTFDSVLVSGNTYMHPYDTLQHNYGDQYRGEIFLDKSGNVYVASSTRSADFPIVNGFDNTLGGNQDGIIVKLDSSLSSVLFSSYIGGSLEDAGYSVKVDSAYNVYVCGGTVSPDFPVTSGVLSNTFNGGKADGYIVKIDSSGNNILAATYIGTTAYDQCYFIDLDYFGNVYTVGQTKGAMPITAGVYNNPGSSIFIQKLQNDFSALYFSTVVGNGSTVADFSPTAFLVDRCENIYLSGWGGNILTSNTLTGMPLTSNAFQTTTDGYNFYFMVLKRDAAGLIYGSYFGGNISREHVDGGTSRFDKNGIIYQSICAGCGRNSDLPTTPGAWSQTNNSNNCNNGTVKFDFEIIPKAAFQPSSTSGCAPLTVTFSNLASSGDAYFWDFGNGDTTSTEFNPVRTFSTPGNYQVTLIVTDSICRIKDTAIQTITVYAPVTVNAGNDTVLCDTLIRLTATSSGGANQFIWSSNNLFTDTLNSNLSDSTLQYFIPDSMWLYVNAYNGFCSNIDSVYIRVIIPKFNLSTGCNDTTLITAQIIGDTSGLQYMWQPPVNIIGGQGTPQLQVLNPSVGNIYTLTVTNSLNCSYTDSIAVYPLVTTNSGPDIATCDTVTLTAASTGGANQFIWSSNNLFTDTLNSNLSDSTLQYFTTDSTWVYLLATNGFCSDTDSVYISTLFTPFSLSFTCSDTTLITAQINGDTTGLQYTWQPPVNIIGGQGTPQLQVLNPSVGQFYYLTVTNPANCSLTDSIAVSPNVQVDAGANATTCDSTVVTATATGNVSGYVWSSSNTFSDTLSLTNTLTFTDTTGIYWLYVYAGNGFCDNYDSVQVEILLNTPFTLQTECMGDTLSVKALLLPGQYTYVWQPDSLIFSGQGTDEVLLFPDSTVWVTLTVTNTYGCAFTDSVLVQTTGLSAADFTINAQDDTVLLGNSTVITVLPEGDFSYTWMPVNATGNTVEVTPKSTTTYWVTISDSLGCSYRKQITIYAVDVICEEPYIYIPNAFTPNGDGKNDVLYLRGEYIDEMDLKIFDRWGELVFETDKPSVGWDGTYKGEPVEPAVFVYHLRVICWGGTEFFKKGNITVIR